MTLLLRALFVLLICTLLAIAGFAIVVLLALIWYVAWYTPRHR